MKITNVWGEASGRLGAMVFSRGRGGAYVRKYVTPTNPNSQKQRTVRERFSARTLEFRALPASTKAMWAEYVNTYYCPLTGSGRGNALNAFVSCRQAVDNCNQVAAVTTCNPPTTLTQPFELPNVPPDRPLAANVVANGNIIIPTIRSVQYANGELSVEIDLPGAGALDDLIMRNENGVRVSLNLYVSSPSGGSYFSNPYRTLFAATGAAKFSSIPDETITMTGSATLQANANYRCTLVLMDEFGQQMAIGTYDFTVPANP